MSSNSITLPSVFVSTIMVGALLSFISVSATPKQQYIKGLSAFLMQVENNHPQLKINLARLEATKASVLVASQPLYNPEINLDTERVSFNNNGRAEVVTFGINQTLDWHGKRPARRNVAVIAQQIVQSEQQSINQQLISSAFIALADYQAQREIIQAHQKRITLSRQMMFQAKRLYDAGEISKLDYEQLSLSQSRTVLILNQEKAKLANFTQILQTTSGSTGKQWPALPYSPPKLRIEKVKYDSLVTNLPEYKTNYIRIAQERSKMRLRTREQKADPTIGLRVGMDDSQEILGLTLSIPLNIRNTYQAEVDEARANIKIAESELDNTKYLLESQLRSSAKSYQLSYQNWQSWLKITNKSLKNQNDLLMRLWKSGELSTSDYLVQLNQIREAELNNIELKGNVWKAWFNWLAVSNQLKSWINSQTK